MRVINFPHQHRIIAPGQYIESFRVPCEGTASTVEGSIIIVAKDYTNQPTFDQADITWLNTVFHMMPNNTLTFAATFAGAAVTPLVTFKDSDVGVHIEGVISTGGELLTITLNLTAVPDPFMLYIRPMLRVYGLTTGTAFDGQKRQGTELLFTPPNSAIPFKYDSANPMVDGQVGGIEVIKEVVRNK